MPTMPGCRTTVGVRVVSNATVNPQSKHYMPYAPTVNDNSGQIMAQGIQGFGQQLAQGLQDYQKHKIHNQALQGENEGIINALTTNPDLAKYLPQDSQKLLEKKMKAGGLSLADSARLNGYLTAGVKTYQMDVQMKTQQAQAAEMQAQAAQRMAQAQQLASAPAELQQLMGGVQQPQPSPVQAPVAPVQGNSVAPAPEGTFRYGQQPQGPQTPPVSALDAMRRYVSSGKPINPYVADHLKNLVVQEREAAAQADKATKLNVVKMREGDQEVTYDARTGKELARGKVNSPTMPAEDQIKVETEKHRINSTNDAAVKRLEDLSTDAEKAQSKLSAIQRIDSLYAAGAESGFAQKSLTEISSALARATGKKDLKLANQQQINAELAKFAVDSADSIKGQGSITENERQMVKDTAASTENTPEANRALLAVVHKMSTRTVALQKLRLELEDAGVEPARISREIEKVRVSMPLFDESATAPKSDPAADILKKYGIK